MRSRSTPGRGEQARGETLDARTDLFSLGLVIYEMATGRPAFAGQSAADTLKAILTQTPVAPKTLVPELPAEVERIITKAVEKTRERRYQPAADPREELKRASRARHPLDLAAPRARGVGHGRGRRDPRLSRRPALVATLGARYGGRAPVRGPRR